MPDHPSRPVIAVRPFAEDDLPALQRIRAAAFAPVFASFRALLGQSIADSALAGAEAEQAALLDALCDAHPDRVVLVALCDGMPVGFAAVIVDPANGVGELGLNAVDPAYQRQGIATTLHARALDVMRERGMRVAFVGAGADDSHAPALAAYRKAGFGPAIPSQALYRLL